MLHYAPWVKSKLVSLKEPLDWNELYESDPVLRWALKLTPLLSLHAHGMRMGVHIPPGGEGVQAKVAVRGLNISNQQTRIRGLRCETQKAAWKACMGMRDQAWDGGPRMGWAFAWGEVGQGVAMEPGMPVTECLPPHACHR